MRRVTPTWVTSAQTCSQHEGCDVAVHLTDRVKVVLDIASQRSEQRGAREISPTDVLYSIIDEGKGVAANALRRARVTYENLNSVSSHTEDLAESHRELEKLLVLAEKEASAFPKPQGLSVWPVVGTEHLLLALLRSGNAACDILRKALASESMTTKELYERVSQLLQ
jgi:ATP-dependent Clp protease ATP-binding subunit ClpA